METPDRELPDPPPRLFDRPVAARPAPEPVAGSEAVAALHRRWAQLRGVPERDPGAGDAGSGAEAARPASGVRAKVRAKVVNAAVGVQAAERAMTGDLVRALDAIAGRVDELSGRLADLERVVQDVVDTVSEDLARVHEASAGPPAGEAHDGAAAPDRAAPAGARRRAPG